MAKLYYGNGNCTIEGSEIRGVEIRYRGAIEIEDKTSDSFVITHQNNGILIFPIGEGTLNELFDYVGEFKIISVTPQDCPLMGDVNSDGVWNVLDIVALANCVLADDCDEDEIVEACAADVNADGNYNVLDIVALANCILADSCEDDL